MLIRFLSSLIATAIASTAVIVLPQPSFGADDFKVSFFCAETSSPTTKEIIPTTFARTQRGNVPMIYWKSQYFSQSNDYTPLNRCKEVSRRFQTFSEDGILVYLTTGRVNAQNVICVTDILGGSCKGLLLTLEPTDKPNQVLEELLDVRVLVRGPITRSAEVANASYIDLQDFLDSSPVQEVKP